MLNFFRRKPQQEFVVLARYCTGHWFKQFVVKAPSAYEAARKFDTTEPRWTRVSGATLYTEV